MRKCIICGERLCADNILMKCTGMPSGAQNIPSADELDKDRAVDLSLHQCPGCGLVQFDCKPVSYYKDVIRAGGFSSTMTELRKEQYGRFISLCGLEGKKIVEVGCGQGEFLRCLEGFPVSGFGIEHSEKLVEAARAAGLNVSRGFTDTADTVFPDAPYDAFLSFNFLEHQPDPNTMLACIRNNLTDEGVGLITVPSFEYILENDGFYELLRDHIANYTEQTLRFLVERNGFDVLDTRTVNRDTIEMTVKKRWKTDVSGLSKNFDALCRQMRAFVRDARESGKKVAVWGASHQGFTAISTSRVNDGIAYIIDSAPFKQGRFSPASHLPIVSPDHFLGDPVDRILIIAPGYTDEIARTIRTRFGGGVEIFTIRSKNIERYSD